MALQTIIDKFYEKKGDIYGIIETYIDSTNDKFTPQVYQILGDADGEHIRFQKNIQKNINQLQPEDRTNPDLLFAKQDYEEAFDELEYALQRGIQLFPPSGQTNGGSRRRQQRQRRKTRKASLKRKSKKARSKKV